MRGKVGGSWRLSTCRMARGRRGVALMKCCSARLVGALDEQVKLHELIHQGSQLMLRPNPVCKMDLPFPRRDDVDVGILSEDIVDLLLYPRQAHASLPAPHSIYSNLQTTLHGGLRRSGSSLETRLSQVIISQTRFPRNIETSVAPPDTNVGHLPTNFMFLWPSKP